MPAAVSSAITSRMRCCDARSRPVIGSSRSSRSGRATRAWATSTLALPAGEITERPAHHAPDVHPLRRLVDRPPVGRTEPAEQAALPVATHAQYLTDADRHPPVLQLVLGDEGHADPARRSTLPDVGRSRPARTSSSVLFPAAVGPDEGHRFTRRRIASELGARATVVP